MKDCPCVFPEMVHEPECVTILAVGAERAVGRLLERTELRHPRKHMPQAFHLARDGVGRPSFSSSSASA